MYDQNFGTCRGCGKQIIWTRTSAGRNMPCDPGLITFTAGKGNETFITPDGQTIRGHRSEEGDVSRRPQCGMQAGEVPVSKGASQAAAQQGDYCELRHRGYIPHWATCPNWKQFKR